MYEFYNESLDLKGICKGFLKLDLSWANILAPVNTHTLTPVDQIWPMGHWLATSGLDLGVGVGGD